MRLNRPATGFHALSACWVIAGFVVLNPVRTLGQTGCPNTPAADPRIGGSNTQVAWLQYIASELRRMRVELLEDRREIQQTRMQELQRDVETVQSQQQRLDEEQRSQTQQAAEIESQLSQSNLTKAEREELEARKADLLNISPARYATSQAALAQREARARDRLAQQQQRLRLVEQQLRELAPTE